MVELSSGGNAELIDQLPRQIKIHVETSKLIGKMLQLSLHSHFKQKNGYYGRKSEGCEEQVGWTFGALNHFRSKYSDQENRTIFIFSSLEILQIEKIVSPLWRSFNIQHC